MSNEGVTSATPAEDLTSRSYDYIICGGGTAGLAVASRLTEDENVTVVVLEAGGNALNDLLVDAPSMYTQTWGNPNYDWDYKTVPQKGTAGRVHGWIRGKVLGGSSAVNYGMFSMASKQDLDNWGELGNKGWSFEDLKPYYRKFETYHPASEAYGEKIDNKYLDKSLRGTSGPIHISFAETDVTWSQDMWPKTVMLQVTRRILPLTNDEMAEGLWTSTSKGNGHCGARGHVMCHPAKTRHPAKPGMAVSLGMAVHPRHPAKRSQDGMDGMAGLEAMRI